MSPFPAPLRKSGPNGSPIRRLLAELHRDSLYPMMGKTLGWLELTVGKPQGRSLCVWGVASGSAASHPNPGSSGMVEFSEESPDPYLGYHLGLPPAIMVFSDPCDLRKT